MSAGRRRSVFVMILVGLALSLGGCYEAGASGGDAGAEGGADADTDSDTDSDADSDTDSDTDTGTDTCADVGIYGPQPCTSDEQCAEEYGDGWWCDEDYVIEYEGCEFVWPTCVGDTPLYGVQACADGPDDAPGDAPGVFYGEEG